jgi:hypothetical protein
MTAVILQKLSPLTNIEVAAYYSVQLIAAKIFFATLPSLVIIDDDFPEDEREGRRVH